VLVQVGNSGIFFLIFAVHFHWFFKYIGGVYFFFNLKTDPQRMQAIDLIKLIFKKLGPL
jgi:hypothetical protein